jgi:hypothetical protein
VSANGQKMGQKCHSDLYRIETTIKHDINVSITPPFSTRVGGPPSLCSSQKEQKQKQWKILMYESMIVKTSHLGIVYHILSLSVHFGPSERFPASEEAPVPSVCVHHFSPSLDHYPTLNTGAMTIHKDWLPYDAMLGWLRQRLFFFRRFWIYDRFRMPVIDRHRYTVGWNLDIQLKNGRLSPPVVQGSTIPEKEHAKRLSLCLRKLHGIPSGPERPEQSHSKVRTPPAQSY